MIPSTGGGAILVIIAVITPNMPLWPLWLTRNIALHGYMVTWYAVAACGSSTGGTSPLAAAILVIAKRMLHCCIIMTDMAL